MTERTLCDCTGHSYVYIPSFHEIRNPNVNLMVKLLCLLYKGHCIYICMSVKLWWKSK